MWRRKASGRVLLVGLVLTLLLAGCAPFAPAPSPRPAPTLPLTQGCPVWATPPGAAIPPPPATASAAEIAQYNARLVLETPRPVRNPYRITQQIVKHLATPIPCRTSTTPAPERVGDSRSFTVVQPSQTGYRTTTAKLVAATAHVYMYVEVQALRSVDAQALTQAALTFEQRIAPTDRRAFGDPWPTGPNGDGHVTVLNAQNLGPIGGYFSSVDELPRAVMPQSNERQMIYINLDSYPRPGGSEYISTLAHEFQHMIHWYSRPADPAWMNEGMSVVAQRLNNFAPGGVDSAFLAQPGTMLGGWTSDPRTNFAHYGAGYLFLEYLAEHYGGDTLLRALLAAPDQAPLNVDRALAARGSPDRFNDVFAKWVVANALADPRVANGAYTYAALGGQRATPQGTVASYPYALGSAAAPATQAQYSAAYYQFLPSGTAPGTLNLTLRGDAYVPIVPNTPFGGAPAEWWSNSGNFSDTMLTRAFDLRGHSSGPLTLSFQAWYSLEQDFDYAYVMASTDGGKNWTPLRLTDSVTTNPNGANLGAGLTGMSGGGSTPQWVTETADLSAYAGKQLLLRFETITDDQVHQPGLTVNDIRIPQIGFADAVATDNGWQAAGWVRTNNQLPQRYLVQAILYPANGGVPQVVPATVDAQAGTATVRVSDFGGGVAQVLLAISPIAPATTVPARYTLAATVG